MRRFQNLHLSDRQLFLNYRATFKNDINTAHTILDDEQLDTKKFLASDINDITNRIHAIEDYYYQNVPVKLSDLLTLEQTNIDNFEYRGVYDDEVDYYINNFISDDAKNLIFIADEEESEWVQLGLQGEKGTDGMGIEMKFIWNSSTTYSAKDMVSYNNNLYIANVSSTNVTPDTHTTEWFKLTAWDLSSIHTNPNDVASLVVGDIYWEEL